MSRSRVALAVVVVAMFAGCSSASRETAGEPEKQADRGAAVEGPPQRFRIVPDDYHVPYVGTAQDGRKFFLSEELFAPGPGRGSSYVGLFLWKADGTFDEVRVDEVPRPQGVPVGQAAPAGARRLVAQRLRELGDYTLEPIEVAPFTQEVGGVTFGWMLRRYDGTYSLSIEPGDFIAYYAPWDGLDYDT